MSENALQRQVGGNHYTAKIQHVEFCQTNRIPWCEASALKYIARHRKKNGAQDIEKAIHYVEMLQGLDYGRREKVPQDMDPRKFTVSIKDFCDANEIPPLEAEVIMKICWHQIRGESQLMDAVKTLKGILKGYGDLGLLD